MRFAVDTGGTFTDLVIEDDDGTLQVYKSPTTPDDPVEGVLNVLSVAAEAGGVERSELLAGEGLFIHGTTRAINAILTGGTAKTAFLASEGHPDILLFREGGRTDPFNYTRPYPEPYIPRSLTYEVPGRIGSAGEVVRELDEAAVVAHIGTLKSAQVEAVAVCLLWSTLNPAHELRVGELLEEHLPGVPYTLSHQLNPILREYRRASSTAIDASLKPLMQEYLGSLEERLREAGFNGRILILTSNAGVLDASFVADQPIHSINSGPSMAPVAGSHYALIDADTDTAVVADTGGTTYDVSLVRKGRIPTTKETWIGDPFFGHMTGFPSVDVKSVGAGGGSIAWVDEGGLLRVGPQSAGAEPGPVAYGRGGVQPTVTDASLVLGYIDPAYFLGGKMKLDVDAARAAIEEQVASPLGLTVEDAASAIMTLVTEGMVTAIEEITLNQGVDPAKAVLIGGGGGAGLNSVAIAERLGSKRVIIPETGATLSAAGALMSDLKAEYATTLITGTGAFDFEGANTALAQLEDRCRQFASTVGATDESVRIEFALEANYPKQVWELQVPLSGDRIETEADLQSFRDDFHALHLDVFSVNQEDAEVEVIGVRAVVHCRLRNDTVGRVPAGSGNGRAGVRRLMYFPATGYVETEVHRLESMPVDEVFSGPAIVESPFTTVVVDPGATVTRGDSGSLVLTPPHQIVDQGERKKVSIAADPAQLAVLTNRMQAVVRSMQNTLFRTARSGLINTGRDFSCCLVTGDDELLAAAESLPIHVMAGPDLSAKRMKELHPELHAGDVFLHNSPYAGNSHAADHSLLAPVIDADGVHRFTVVVKAHLADCGNAVPTSQNPVARDVYNEGALIFDCVKVEDRYVRVDDVLRMCRLRLRAPEMWWGDYLAMLGAVRTAERELLGIGEEYGWDVLHEYVDAWFDYSEDKMDRAIRALPSGSASGSTTHDPLPVTGLESGVPINAKVEVRSDEGLVAVDLTENPDCVPAGINTTEATALTGAMMGIFNSLGPGVPTNGGSFRRLRITLRENCVAGIPRHPVSCSSATTGVPERITSAVQQAIAKLGDGSGMAASGACLSPSNAIVSGTDPRYGTPFVDMPCIGATGGPGNPWSDGWLSYAGGCAGMNAWENTEMAEILRPMRIETSRVLPDTEGAGKFRGSPSVLVEFTPVGTSIDAAVTTDNTMFPAEGVRGGLPGAAGWAGVLGLDGQEQQVSGYARLNLAPGERLISRSSAGGGYGSPHERDPERVRHDVLEGYITRARAESIYGVIVRPDGTIDTAPRTPHTTTQL
ncbi:hydantoinase B/oxoprolinase family protein [Leekyejoonella antrihumi]|uniref:hydantoinase B/oxoprolinase family protein n=1 Tax=Leekyejoonella antrihumi TaxID=1660198 RepID=UPI001C976F57|nr:hydantoinase B/oxoprolinase family protein [Leekyejoonella antrihumi]